jgi:hypothetical protein
MAAGVRAANQSWGLTCSSQAMGGLLSSRCSCSLLLNWRIAYPTANSLQTVKTHKVEVQFCMHSDLAVD